MPLKYLFTATFADGSVIEQDANDISKLDPKKRSMFYDVLAYSEKSPMVSFLLKGNGHEYKVDLQDGHFEIDGISFLMHEDILPFYRVVFFRNHTHSFNVGQVKSEEISHDIVYRMGWQSTYRGTNYQRVMQFD